MKTVLYIHGMGGGGDSRIPSILASALDSMIKVVVRTYDFDPEVAAGQISMWVDELKPSLIIGESLGSLHAIRIVGIPHLFVSPSLNAPLFFDKLSWLTLIPGMTRIFDRIYKPREGDRQKLHFVFPILSKYGEHRHKALENSLSNGSKDYFYAFFGTRDHYRKSGIVSIRTWKKYFGNNFSMYDGTHFMEEEYIYARLVPKVLEVLNIK
jgi:hypothetical protein